MCLRDSHYTALIAHRLHIFADFVAGVHGIVSAVVKEVTNIVVFENFQQTFIVGIVHIRVLQLISDGQRILRSDTEIRCGHTKRKFI